MTSKFPLVIDLNGAPTRGVGVLYSCSAQQMGSKGLCYQVFNKIMN